ncbi:MAG: carboxylesterase 2 (esterase ii) [Burkholderiales bacterium]|jgi:phospholipase/carboxylesterase|nr:carboxylesterase 2 (esterase ii) [Burkholderiales bacterium]
MQTQLEYIERYSQPKAPVDAVVILLHGLGADNNDFVPLVQELPLKHSIKFIFPNAPKRPITLNGGYVMRGWYDIKELSNLNHLTDTDGINQSIRQIEAIIQQQIDAGFTADKIIIAGFSQGGVISYITGINSKYKLGGILAMSCYLPVMPTRIEESINKTTPFFALHGTEDQVVPYIAGVQAYEELKKHGYNIKWAEYPMPHSVCLQEIADIGAWLDSIIK